MNLIDSLLKGLKSLAITAIVPIVSADDPAIGKELSDAAAAFSDGKLSLEEAQQLALDTIDVAAEKVPKYADACAKLKKNIIEDIPLLSAKIIPDFEATYNAFKAAA